MTFVPGPEVPGVLVAFAWVHLFIALALVAFGAILAASADAGWFGILTVWAFAAAIGGLSVYWLRRARRTPAPQLAPVDQE